MSPTTELRWRAKILAKVVLARLPVPYRVWRRIGVFRHGRMRSGDYAVQVFDQVVERAGLDDVRGLRLLELGPGDSLFSAVLANAAGAASSVHVDVGEFVDRDLDRYREFAELLTQRGHTPIDMGSVASLEELLERCHARYLTQGLESLRGLPAGSIDLAWSQSTIEHVRAAELPALLGELRRVMSAGGRAVHLVDLRDHLADGLNNLRFSRRVWESRLFADSGFYTNRARLPTLLELFADAGFSTEVLSARRWETLPTPRRRLAPEFRDLADDDLRVAVFVVRLTPR